MTRGAFEFTIEKLGECRFASPMQNIQFTSDEGRLLYYSHLNKVRESLSQPGGPPAFEIAGPREKIFFDPKNLKCGIVTCGGLCPGLNDVIRAIVMSLHHHYGVRKIYGFRYGYEGLIPRFGHEPMELTPESTNSIHEFGGTILGTSRGPQNISEMVDTLVRMQIGILFVIGGDGTLRGGRDIAQEVKKRGLSISVVGIPKTIDNDISFTQKTFGFETATAEARRAIYAAHSEAIAARNGIGLVKLMGRESGFIAAYAAIANNHANFCLIPEVPFSLEVLLPLLEKRIALRKHVVIVVSEGAGQDLMEKKKEKDASGNAVFSDIGLFLKEKIKEYFKKKEIPLNLKYIDPSYIIRSLPANAHDAAFCILLGHNAVHAAMTGRTDLVVGFWKSEFTHVPIALAVSRRKKIDPNSWLWYSVLAATGQPAHLV